jgi:hypothetical protein
MTLRDYVYCGLLFCFGCGFAVLWTNQGRLLAEQEATAERVVQFEKDYARLEKTYDACEWSLAEVHGQVKRLEKELQTQSETLPDKFGAKVAREIASLVEARIEPRLVALEEEGIKMENFFEHLTKRTN